jgi:hypothetical protein
VQALSGLEWAKDVRTIPWLNKENGSDEFSQKPPALSGEEATR